MFRLTEEFERYTNITVISENDFPYEKRRSLTMKKMLPFNGLFCHDYAAVSGVKQFCNFIKGAVVEINRWLVIYPIRFIKLF